MPPGFPRLFLMIYSPLQTANFSLAALLILLLPGLAWLVWSRTRRGFLVLLADAVGISVSLTALIALAGFYLDSRFTRPLLTRTSPLRSTR